MLHGALSLINRKNEFIDRQKDQIELLEIEKQALRGSARSYKAELERVTEKFNCQQTVYSDLSEIIREQKAEIERLNISHFQFISDINAYKEKLKTAKSEAVKEFAERLKFEKATGMNWFGKEHYSVKIEDIDELVKEMVGADNG